MGNKRLESSSAETDQWVWVGGKFNISHQCPGGQDSQLCPGIHQAQQHQPGKGRDCSPLLCTDVAAPQLLCAVSGASIEENQII